MKKIKNCKHCDEQFEARRSNHLYCTISCKTLASYKRNQYKYVPGHYEINPDIQLKNSKLMVPDEITTQINTLESKINALSEKQNNKNLNVTDIKSTAAGTLVADASVYGLKKMFAPNTLPATKGDVETLKKEINELKNLINNNNKGGFGVY